MRKGDELTTFMCRVSRNIWSLNLPETPKATRPVVGLLYLLPTANKLHIHSETHEGVIAPGALLVTLYLYSSKYCSVYLFSPNGVAAQRWPGSPHSRVF